MPKKDRNSLVSDWKETLASDREFFVEVVREVLQETLETEMTECLGAAKGARSSERKGYRSGYYTRSLVTRVGALELRVPQDRQGLFSTEVFERYRRSEKALVDSLIQMYVQGVSTRKVKEITETLCGHSFSASSVSRITASLDAELEKFSTRRLEEPYPYVVVDARYERVREDGVVRSRAVLIAIGINEDGRRCILGVDLAARESVTSWRDFFQGLRERGLQGVEFIVSDDHAGLRKSIPAVFPEAVWQRCYVHFLRNALDHLPRKADDDCLKELRWLYDRRNIAEARRDLAAWLQKWQPRYGKLCGWVEDNIDETLSFYRLPVQHYKHMKSTNMIERLNEEIKRRTHIVRIFPNEASCLRLIRALAVEQDEEWLEGTRYLNMDFWREQKKQVRLGTEVTLEPHN